MFFKSHKAQKYISTFCVFVFLILVTATPVLVLGATQMKSETAHITATVVGPLVTGSAPGQTGSYIFDTDSDANFVVYGTAPDLGEVHVFRDGVLAAIVNADTEGYFFYEVLMTPSGVSTFSFKGFDVNGIETASQSVVAEIGSADEVTYVGDVVLSPSITTSPAGANLYIQGFSTPNTDIQIVVIDEAGSVFAYPVSTNELGRYELEIPKSTVFGEITIYAVSFSDFGISPISRVVNVDTGAVSIFDSAESDIPRTVLNVPPVVPDNYDSVQELLNLIVDLLVDEINEQERQINELVDAVGEVNDRQNFGLLDNPYAWMLWPALMILQFIVFWRVISVFRRREK